MLFRTSSPVDVLSSELSKWSGDFGKVIDKTAIPTVCLQKALQLLYVGGKLTLGDSRNFIWISVDTGGGDMPEVLDTRTAEMTLGSVQS